MTLLRKTCLLLAVVGLAAPALFIGLTWGLPSHAADPYLFGQRTPWTGTQIIALAGGWDNDPNRGADVAIAPLVGRDRVLTLNSDDAARAAIVRRYRLFTNQPDEMITLRALAGMRPNRLQLDPKLYQYGGLWIYPVGGLLKAASLLRIVSLRSDVEWYLDYPAQFGHLYVVARFYSALWGVVGVLAVFWIVRQITERPAPAFFAGITFGWMPVIVNGAHEAKPHLGGAALMLVAVVCASSYVRNGGVRRLSLVGIVCGAATAMVPTAYPIFLVIPLMLILRGTIPFPRQLNQMVLGGLVGVAVYLVLNPYLVINLITNRSVLRSNLGNSAAMYHPAAGSSAVLNAASLIAAGTTPLLATAGAIGALMLALRVVLKRRARSTPPAWRAPGLLLATPAIFATLQFCALAAGKPGEYGRFAMLPDTFLLVETMVAVATFVRRPAAQWGLLIICFAATVWGGGAYLRGFIRDSGRFPIRLQYASRLKDLCRGTAPTLAVNAEPAPYCLPPVDLFRWKILLAPRGLPESRMNDIAQVAVRPFDAGEHLFLKSIAATPISWADKPFQITTSAPSRGPWLPAVKPPR